MSISSLVPRYAFLIQGTGTHVDRLQAFDRALLTAGPLAHNLVTVSSILPAGCKIINPEEGFKMLVPGQITFCVMARQDSNTIGETIGASVGLVIPKAEDQFGYISEFHGVVKNKSETVEKAKNLAKQMFATKIQLEKSTIKEIELLSAAATIDVKQTGEWVCALAICVFVL